MNISFEEYVKTIVSATFGFEPKIRSNMVNDFTVQVFIDGTEEQRRQMMGREAKNFKLLKEMVKLFGKRKQVFSFLYIEFPKDYKKLPLELETTYQ